jgi:hypothetical protein
MELLVSDALGSGTAPEPLALRARLAFLEWTVVLINIRSNRAIRLQIRPSTEFDGPLQSNRIMRREPATMLFLLDAYSFLAGRGLKRDR